MEDSLQKLSNQYRTLYYAIQLKVTDTAQILRTNGPKLTENEIKTFTNEEFNIFSMTEKMFNQVGVNHLYQLLKTMNSNLNSMVVLLIERVQKLNQRIWAIQRPLTEENQSGGSKHEAEQLLERQNSFIEVKRNKLGGIHLFNENYARYLEDPRILEQIKYEKQQRIVKKKNELLSCMIYNQLNHKTDVQGEATSNDDIAKYIIESRSKGSIYNYVPYYEELQEILTFFQNSQTEANNFLGKKSNNDSHEIGGGKFSFADFQREIQYKNKEFQKKVMEKLVKAVQKLKQKQRQMEETHTLERQAYLKLMQIKKPQNSDRQIQTEFQFDYFIRQCQNERRDIQFKCQALQSHKIQQIKYIQRQSQLMNEISYKGLQIQKLEIQMKDLQGIIMNLKKMVRQDKAKKHIVIKEDIIEKIQVIENRQNSQSKKEKQSVAGSQLAIGVQDYVSMNSNNKLKKTSNKSYIWKRKISNDGTSLMGLNQSQAEREEISRAHTRKAVKYNLQNEKSENNLSVQQQAQNHKPKGASFKFNRQIKSKQTLIQTQFKQAAHSDLKEEIHTQQPNSGQKIFINIEDDEQQNVSPYGPKKTAVLRLQSDPLHTNLTSLSNLEKEQPKIREKSSQNKKTTSNPKKESKEFIKQTKENRRQSKQQPKQQKQNAKEAKDNIQITIKKQPQVKQKQDTPKKPTVNSKPKQNVKANQSNSIKKRVSPKRLDKELPQDIRQSKAETQHHETKEQHLYRMFEVVQQQAQEEKQSIKNTQRGSLIDMLQTPMKLDYQSVQKLSKALRDIKTQNNYFYKQLYSITIKPFKPIQNLTSQSTFSKDLTNHSIHYKAPISSEKSQKFDAIQQFRHSTETSEISPENATSINNVLQVFDKIQKINKTNGDSNSLQKLKNWKKKIESTFKSNLISMIDIQNIANVLSISANKCSSVQTKIHSVGSNSVDIPQRKSLADLDEEHLTPIDDGKYKHNRHNSLNDPFHQKIGKQIQNQLRLQQLISFQAFSQDFSAKFEKYHSHCHQGLICTHVTKYFEIIMKHIEDTRQKQKNLLALHIQNIGTKISTQTDKDGKKLLKIQQQAKEMKRSQLQNRYQGKSMQKMKKNKSSMLPNINQHRSSLCSPRK